MSVIAATRFGPESKIVAEVAVRLARLLGVSLELVHVLEADTTFPLPPDARLDNLGRARCERAVELLALESGRHTGVTVATSVLQGDVVSALAEKVRAAQPELLVVGGSATTGKASYSGVAEDVAQSLTCPVLVVRRNDTQLLSALEAQRPLRLFVALDRTRASDVLVRFVATVRRHTACEVIVSHNYWPPVEHERLGIPFHGDAFASDARIEEILSNEIRGRFAASGDTGSLQVRVTPHAASASVDIIASAHAAKADIVLVGSHRRDAFGRVIHGSVSRDILRHSDVPVLCVAASSKGAHDARPVGAVLAATDFSESGNAAVAHALRVLGGNGELTVMHVAARPLDGVSRPWPREPLTSLETNSLRERLSGLVPENVTASVRYLIEDEGPAGERIVQAAERVNADIIVIGASGKGPVDRALIGSTASDVLQRARRPVTVVKQRPA